MINLDYLNKMYFWCDKPVPYKVENNIINIFPVMLLDSEMFLSWIDILTIDKNASSNVEDISMSYLDFIIEKFILSKDEDVVRLSSLKLYSILKTCLKWEINDIKIITVKPHRYAIKYNNIILYSKYFEDIRRIILYQNIYQYDDTYINPDFKANMDEYDRIVNKDIDFPNLERRIAIITTHTGITKEIQLNMTFRSHMALFDEVCGEVETLSTKTALIIGNMFAQKPVEIKNWIYRKKENKLNKYFSTPEKFNKSMGGSGQI